MLKLTIKYFQLIVLSALLVACSTPKESTEQINATDGTDHPLDESGESLEKPETVFKTDSLFQLQLSELFKHYTSLQKALVASDTIEAVAAAKAMDASHKNLDQKLLTGDALHEWMGFSGVMETALNGLSTAPSLSEQRKAFSGVSDQMYRYIRAFGLSGSTAYYAYCPMALNNKGAYWLTDAREVRNPYFGDQMLKCGALRQELN